MNSKRKYFWILTLLLAVPMVATGAPAAPYQGGGYGEDREEAAAEGRCLRMTS